MSHSESQSGRVLELAEEFLERYRKGERPPLREYIDRHPELAAEIKEVFPAMAMLENIALADSSLEGGQSSQGSRGSKISLKQLGDYRIIREIGHGGMGVVYEAEQVSLGRHVALKVLPNQALADARQKRRFEREAKAAAKLHHTNIVPVFGVGEHDGMPYYVMQFIQGLGLDVVLEELNRMQPGAAHTPTGLPAAGEIRVSRRSVAAADVARSLLTGAFEMRAEGRGARGEEAEEDAEEDAEAPEQPAVVATLDRPQPSLLASDPSPLASSPSSSGLSDSFTVSSSSITLPGSGASAGCKSGSKKQTYWQSVANIGRQVADALDYAHKQGILHRDVKPSNLLLDLRGTVWVTDFGLAKVAGPGADNLTHTGDILGTLRYMPPEAFEGKSDARGDVYSLGLTMYELLALRPAFDDKDRKKLIKQVTSGEPAPLHKIRRETPRDLVTIIHKAIDRDPGRRYATAEDMASDLQRFLDDEPILARRQTQLERYWRWARRNPGMAVLGGVLTAVLVLATLVSLVVASHMSTLADKEAKAADDERTARRQAEEAKNLEVKARGQAERAEKDATEQRNRADDEAKLARKAERAAKDLAQAEADAKKLAQRETLRAEAEKKRAEQNLTRAEWLVYAGKLMLAQTDFETGNGGFALKYLDECQWNLRGWEHHHLWTRINAKQTFQGHARWVWCVAFSPDGKRIVFGSQDATATVWDAENCRELLTLRGHTCPVRGVAFSPDGKRLVTGAGDPGRQAETKVWDVATGRQLLAIDKGLAGEVWSVAFSPDGKRFATGAGARTGGPGRAKVWDAVTGKQLLDLSGHATLVSGVAFSPDGKRIVTGSGVVHSPAPGQAKVWDAGTGRELFDLKGHRHGVNSVAFSPDGKRIVTGAGNPGAGEVKVWDAGTGRELLDLKGHIDWVSSVAYSPDNSRIVTGGEDSTVRAWDTETGQEIFVLKGHPAPIASVAFSPDGRRLVTAGHETVRVWDAEESQKVLTLQGQRAVRSVAFSPDGKRVLTGGDDSTPRVWDAATGRQLLALQGHTAWVLGVAFSPDGKRLVTGGGDQTTRVWDAATGRQLLVLKGPVDTVAFSPDGKRIVTGEGILNNFANVSGQAKVWDAVTGQELLALKGHTNWVRGAAFSPDGKRIVTGGNDSTARVWDAATGQELLTLKGHNGLVSSVAFSPDSKHIVTGSYDDTAKVWDAATGREALALKGHKRWLTAVAFSPDGKRIVTGSEDRTVKVWDAQAGHELLTLKGHTSVVFSVAFSPDGKRLVTGSYDNTAKVWNAERRPTRSADGHVNPAGAASEPWPLPDAAERIRYHTEQAARAGQQKRSFTAEFHLGRVRHALALLKDNPSVWLRLYAKFTPDEQKVFTQLRPDATAAWLRVLPHQPDLQPAASAWARARVLSGVRAFESGKLADAIRDLQLARNLLRILVKLNPHDSRLASNLAVAAGFLGSALRDSRRPVEALASIQEQRRVLESMHHPDALDLYNLACGYAQLSVLLQHAPKPATAAERQALADRALDALRRSIAAGMKNFTQMERDRDLDPLRQRADFRALLRQGKR